MKSSARISDEKPPGALEVETLGVHKAAPTETSTFQSQAAAEVVMEVETAPRPQADDPSLPPVAARPHAKHGGARALPASARVLVADDSPNVRESLVRALEAEGYEVLVAANGREALEKFVPGTIDLVLLDLEMPVKSGWETFEEMVALDDDQAIILMADRLDAVDLTTTGHLTRLTEKPINLNALLATVRNALAETGARRRSTITSQQSLLRYTKPFVSASPVRSYDHWGIND
jgi:CheY-like chemotaxis protein